jgi:hypothetical protein
VKEAERLAAVLITDQRAENAPVVATPGRLTLFALGATAISALHVAATETTDHREFKISEKQNANTHRQG